MIYNELDSLILFKMGHPSLYHIMLGMPWEEIDEYQEEIKQQETDNYDLNDVLKNYSIEVETPALIGCRISEMTISIPMEFITEAELKTIYSHLASKMHVVTKQYNVTLDADDTIQDVDIYVHADLYDMRIVKVEKESIGIDFLVISFVTEDDINLDKLGCLSVIANHEKDFGKEIVEYINQYMCI